MAGTDGVGTNAVPGLRITWVGHSTVLIELDGVRLLTDPVLRKRLTVLLPRVSGPADVSALGPLDGVLVSHLHYDHLDLRSLDLLGTVPVVAPAGGARLLRKRGHEVTELAAGEHTRIGAVEVAATEAVHPGRRAPWHRDDADAVGFMLSGSQRAYFAGDTDLFEGMDMLGPGLDVALLPISGWGARVPAGHLDPPRAAEALRRLRPRIAVPIHWGTYRRVDMRKHEALLRAPAEEFARLAAEHAPGVDVRILSVGESLDVPVSSAVGANP